MSAYLAFATRQGDFGLLFLFSSALGLVCLLRRGSQNRRTRLIAFTSSAPLVSFERDSRFRDASDRSARYVVGASRVAAMVRDVPYAARVCPFQLVFFHCRKPYNEARGGAPARRSVLDPGSPFRRGCLGFSEPVGVATFPELLRGAPRSR